MDGLSGGGKAKVEVAEEIEGFLRVYKDGSVLRSSDVVGDVPPSRTESVASKDEVIDGQSGVWARVYLPRTPKQRIKNMNNHRKLKLPVVIYFHGGGFCMGSASWSMYHEFLCAFASQANSIVISVNYRLAPEHRLPVQYDDGFGAVQWVRRQALQTTGSASEENWVRSYGDPSRCFLAGDSSGANIVHHVAARIGALCCRDDEVVKPVEIRGAILIQPFFSGSNVALKWERETFDPGLPQHWIDVFWRLALPVGANRNHWACSPLAGQAPDESVQLPRVLLCVAERDVLRETNLEYHRSLMKAGRDVRLRYFKGVGHGFYVLCPRDHATPELTKELADFIAGPQNYPSNKTG